MKTSEPKPSKVHVKLLEGLNMTHERDIELRDIFAKVASTSDGSITKILTGLSERDDLTEIEKSWMSYQFGRLVGEGKL